MGVLQKALVREAGTIRTLSRQLDSQLRGAWWKGPDAEKFRGSWDADHKTQLERVAAALDVAAKTVATNITQQTQASQS